MAKDMIELKIANENLRDQNAGLKFLMQANSDLAAQVGQQEREIQNLYDQNAGLSEIRDQLVRCLGERESALAQERLSRDVVAAYYRGTRPDRVVVDELTPQELMRTGFGPSGSATADLGHQHSPYAQRPLSPQELAQMQRAAFYVPPGGMVEIGPSMIGESLALPQQMLREICDCTPRGGRLGALRGAVFGA
jgi:hypothetical protein